MMTKSAVSARILLALFSSYGAEGLSEQSRDDQTGKCDFKRQLEAFESWKYILHAFHWAAHLDYQHLCVQEHASEDRRGLKCASLVLEMWGLDQKFVEKKANTCMKM